MDAHFGARPGSRFIALIGDAELDEGNIWEAVSDPATDGLGDVMWIIDVNRQSLDRVVPGIRIAQWKQQFTGAGWHVVEAKYGHRLQAAFARPGGESLRAWIDEMPNEHYQSLFGLPAPSVRQRFLDGAPDEVRDFCAGIADDAELAGLVTDLAGHDFRSLLAAFGECDAEKDRPSVLFAYTVKGWGLPIAGNPRNHSALLSTAQIDQMRERLGLTLATEWDRLDPMTAAGQWVAARREHLARAPRHTRRPRPCPIPPTCAPAGRSPPRRRSAGSSSACPATRASRPISSPPRPTSPPPPTWPASSTAPASSARPRAARGARTPR